MAPFCQELRERAFSVSLDPIQDQIFPPSNSPSPSFLQKNILSGISRNDPFILLQEYLTLRRSQSDGTNDFRPEFYLLHNKIPLGKEM